MSGPMMRAAYERLIAENLAWLSTLPHSLERDHVRLIVERSIAHEYDAKAALDAATARAEEAERRLVDAKRVIEQRDALLDFSRRGITTTAAVNAALRDYPDANVSALYVPASEALEYQQAWRRDMEKGRRATERAEAEASELRAQLGRLAELAQAMMDAGDDPARDAAYTELDSWLTDPSVSAMDAMAQHDAEVRRATLLEAAEACDAVRDSFACSTPESVSIADRCATHMRELAAKETPCLSG